MRNSGTTSNNIHVCHLPPHMTTKHSFNQSLNMMCDGSKESTRVRTRLSPSSVSVAPIMKSILRRTTTIFFCMLCISDGTAFTIGRRQTTMTQQHPPKHYCRCLPAAVTVPEVVVKITIRVIVSHRRTKLPNKSPRRTTHYPHSMKRLHLSR